MLFMNALIVGDIFVKSVEAGLPMVELVLRVPGET